MRRAPGIVIRGGTTARRTARKRRAAVVAGRRACGRNAVRGQRAAQGHHRRGSCRRDGRGAAGCRGAGLRPTRGRGQPGRSPPPTRASTCSATRPRRSACSRSGSTAGRSSNCCSRPGLPLWPAERPLTRSMRRCVDQAAVEAAAQWRGLPMAWASGREVPSGPARAVLTGVPSGGELRLDVHARRSQRAGPGQRRRTASTSRPTPSPVATRRRRRARPRACRCGWTAWTTWRRTPACSATCAH